MLHSAHIFIGKEFVPLVEAIGTNIAKQNSDSLQYINLYNLVGEGKGIPQIRNLTIETPQDALSDTILQWNSITPEAEEDYASFWATKIYDAILNVTNSAQDQLYVFLHLPLYKSSGIDAATELCKAINADMRPVCVDFVGYCDDLAPFIEPSSKDKPTPSAKIVPAIKAMYDKLDYTPISNHFVVIQNRTQKGISLLCKEDGVEPFHDMISQLTLLFASYYDSIFDSRVQVRDVIGIGFSSLYFDAYLFAEYLLQKTMMGVIDNQSVNNNNVDVNEANKEANEILKNKRKILSEFFERWSGKERETETDTNAYDIITEQIQGIYDKTLQYFRENKDMTAKAAVLASLLSQTECELFSSSVYNPSNACFDELYDEAIDFFIKEDLVEYYTIDGTKPENPIQELKQTNIKLLQAEGMARTLKELIGTLENQIEKSENVRKCSVDEDGYFSFDDKKFRLLPDFNEGPLKDTYEEHPIAASSIDLRGNFRPIQNQGQQGSCLSFTLTSIFEYMMKASGNSEFDLSEAFLYYNARDLDQSGNVNEDKGTRFHPSIDALRKFGLALEKVWPYKEGVYDEKPNKEAYDDAANRKLITALNVRLNSEAIKSALADGYPVAGSFVLCSSFYNAGEYIPMPTAEEIEESKKKSEDSENNNRHGHHAMTIVGFSDQLRMFLVRNSWGTDWGDKGYCYIPYEYIDNPDLFQFACIFTEIASLDFKKPELKEIPALKINNDDLRIKYYVAQVALLDQEDTIAKLKMRRNSLLEYFERQKTIYSDANSRDEFIQKNVANIEAQNASMKEENSKMLQEQETIFEEFKDKRKKAIINIIIFAVTTSLLLWGYNYLISMLCQLGKITELLFNKLSLSYWWLIPTSIIYAIIAYWSFRKHWESWRNRRDELDLMIANNNKAIKANTLRINLFRFKAFASWKTLTSLENLHSKLTHLYTNMISLINNLRAWYKETNNSCQNINLSSTFPNISLIDKPIIDRYFEETLAKSEVCEMDLCSDLDNYDISAEYLSDLKTNFINGLNMRLVSVLDDIRFDIADHAANNSFNNIAKEIDPNIIRDLDNQALMFVHIQSVERSTITSLNKLLFVPNINKWRNLLYKKFHSIDNPSFEGTDNLYRMTLLRTATLDFDECVALRQPSHKSK